MAKTKIELYTAGTPNGQKANIVLEELGLDYEVRAIDLGNNQQKEESFLKINPNGRIPAVVDKTTSSEGFPVFETYAILEYITATYDKDHKISFPYASPEYWESVQWNVWMQSGLGPMQGQANHFFRYAPEKIQYGIDRYQTETRRLYGVLEEHLKEQQDKGKGLWIVGGKYSIADLNVFCWVNWAEWALGQDFLKEGREKFPAIFEWMDVINGREAVKKGLNIPDNFEMKEKMKTKEGEAEYAKYHSNWVMQGQNEEQEKHKK